MKEYSLDIPEQARVHVPNERTRAVVDAFVPFVKSNHKQVGRVIEALYGIQNACEYEDALERLEIICDSYAEAMEAVLEERR